MESTAEMTFEELQAHIKRIIRYERAIRQAVAEKRSEQRRRKGNGEGRAPLRVSKPTEEMAIANLMPLNHVYITCGQKKGRVKIDNPEIWMTCLDAVRRSLSAFDRRFMAEAFCRSDWSVCSDFFISHQKFYALKKEIIAKVAIKAAAEGLVSL